MKKKINQALNIIIAVLIILFIASGLFKYQHFQKYPDLYVMQSAPWYTGLLINGVLTLALLTVCMILKVILIEQIKPMKRIVLILGIIFLFLTFIGGGYVLINHGQVNAGYAVVPGIWAILCFSYYRKNSPSSIRC